MNGLNPEKELFYRTKLFMYNYKGPHFFYSVMYVTLNHPILSQQVSYYEWQQGK